MIQRTLAALAAEGSHIEVRIKRKSPVRQVHIFDARLTMNANESFTATEQMLCSMTDVTDHTIALSVNFYPEHVTSIIVGYSLTFVWLSVNAEDFPE